MRLKKGKSFLYRTSSNDLRSEGGLLRGGIPFIIMGGIALLLYFQGKYSDARSTFLTGVIIFFVSAASVIYNIDKWSLTKQSGVHFILMIIYICI